jgi:Protein of unknown function DUF262
VSLKSYPMNQSSILRVYSERDSIDLKPPYQRQGDIWSLEKKQLLIDSILNDYDIPKLYFHILDPVIGKYAAIDGRQRIEAIFGFIEGRFALADDFDYFLDSSTKARGLTYDQLATEYPKLKIRFDSYTLPIVLIETTDLDLIEDMFSRLNEAVPLNAAEKRNAFGGPIVASVVAVANHKLFLNKVRFANSRYQHREVAARLLFLEGSIVKSSKIFDTKKVYLDEFAKDKEEKNSKLNLESTVIKILDMMLQVFTDKDELLRSQSAVPIYYLLFREAERQGVVSLIVRSKLLDFRIQLDENRVRAEYDISTANYEFLEYDRLSQQGTNDASSIQKRLEILSEFVGVSKDKISYV